LAVEMDGAPRTWMSKNANEDQGTDAYSPGPSVDFHSIFVVSFLHDNTPFIAGHLR
jgi:hypothetical protein